MGIHALSSINSIYRSKLSKGSRIGLFAGSFDPPHNGHLLVAEQARKSLGLDAIWWNISTKNPLKIKTYNSLIKRYELCNNLLGDKVKLHIPSFLEHDLDIINTVNFLKKLRIHDNRMFVFIIGSDNFVEFHLWSKWQEIFNLIPIYVYPRYGSSMQFYSCTAGIKFKSFRKPLRLFKRSLTNIQRLKQPLWCMSDSMASNRRSQLASRLIRNINK